MCALLIFEGTHMMALTKNLVKSRSHTYLLLCVMALAGCMTAVMESELLYHGEGSGTTVHQPTSTTRTLKWLTSGTTLVAIWLLYVYYQDELTLGKSNCVYEPGETLASTRLVLPMLFEMLVMANTPHPYGGHSAQPLLHSSST
jgi:hypothetical protein